MIETERTGRIIQSDACIREGAEWLFRHEPRFETVWQATGPWPLRLRADGFDQLLSAIISQQVSVASAAAITARMRAAGMIDAATINATSEEDLRALGLSRQKASYAKALAAAGIDFPSLRDLPTQEVTKRLVAVKGIGIWTAEIYAMFSLGRADVFAPGDLALQEAARVLFDLPERPKEKALRQMAEAWSPWRAVAARALWAYYRVDKQREGVL
ncbi:MAG: DNA-3-methyladenine glycosylase 2 family protein [Pelagimonas sp.]|jgi:DNA-3-methyladenine glycosylase II|nr:DNA-3-methyladenine glycosylase 2 family protein [Pelagimonas sp.]